MIRMLRYLIKKFSLLLLSLWTIVTITFFLMKAIPGDPFSDEKEIPAEIMQSLNHYYGLDKSLYQQYFSTLHRLIKGDLGPSIIFENRSTNSLITNSFPISFILGAQSLLFAIIMGLVSSCFSQI